MVLASCIFCFDQMPVVFNTRKKVAMVDLISEILQKFLAIKHKHSKKYKFVYTLSILNEKLY